MICDLPFYGQLLPTELVIRHLSNYTRNYNHYYSYFTERFSHARYGRLNSYFALFLRVVGRLDTYIRLDVRRSNVSLAPLLSAGYAPLVTPLKNRQ